MNNICTSIEQSKHLLELGLSYITADMWWNNEMYPDTWKSPNGYISPAWSLTALLELARNGVCADEMIHLDIESALANQETHIYIESNYRDGITRGNYFGSTPLEAVYNVVVWLLKNNYIKPDKQ